MRLSAELLTRFSNAVLKIYSPTLSSGIPDLYLDAVRGVIDCEHLCYNEFGVNHFCGIADPVIEESLNNRFVALSGQHPSITYVQKTGTIKAVKISDFISQDHWQRLDLYNDFFRKLGIHHQLALMFPVESIQIGFAANREKRDFSEIDRTLLSLLQPHFKQAYENAKALERSQRASDARGGGTIIISTEGTVLFASPKARTALTPFFGPITRDRLPDELHRWVVNNLRDRSSEKLCENPLHPLQRKGEKSDLTVRLSPNFVTGEHFLVLEEQVHLSPFLIFKEFGISKRESEVLAWLAQGKTNPEIAMILDISARTVAHHVERILAKIGVEGRGSAACWALEMQQQSSSSLSVA